MSNSSHIAVWFNENILELYSDEPRELIMYLKNLKKEPIQIKEIYLKLPEGVILINDNKEVEQHYMLNEVFEIKPMEVYAIPLLLRYEPQSERGCPSIDSIKFTITTETFKEEVYLTVKLIKC